MFHLAFSIKHELSYTIRLYLSYKSLAFGDNKVIVLSVITPCPADTATISPDEYDGITNLAGVHSSVDSIWVQCLLIVALTGFLRSWGEIVPSSTMCFAALTAFHAAIYRSRSVLHPVTDFGGSSTSLFWRRDPLVLITV
jgi:hypothetical protein